MRRIQPSLIAFAGLALVAAACGGEETTTTEAAPATTSAAVTTAPAAAEEAPETTAAAPETTAAEEEAGPVHVLLDLTFLEYEECRHCGVDPRHSCNSTLSLYYE